MKIDDFLTEDKVVGIEVGSDYVDVNGTSKQGTLKVPYSTLVQLFGEPQSFRDDPQADVNFEWVIQLMYQDELGEYGEGNEYDTANVAIYNYRYDYEEEKHLDPRSITEWMVGARSKKDVWLLEDYIASKTTG